MTDLLSPVDLAWSVGVIMGALACAFTLWALDRIAEWREERRRVRVMVDRIVAEARAENEFGMRVPEYFEERAEGSALH